MPSLQSTKPPTAPAFKPAVATSRLGLQGVPTVRPPRQQQRLERLTQRSGGQSSRARGGGGEASGKGGEFAWVEKRPLVNGIAQFQHAEHLASEMRAYFGVGRSGHADDEAGGSGAGARGVALAPRWSKATAEPGEQLGRVGGGYARKIDDTSVRSRARWTSLATVR